MIITQTPLRISFAGGGTDFPDYYREHSGAVLSTTIDKYIYCMVKKRFDNKIVAHYRGFEMVDKPDEIKHDLIREAIKLTGIEKQIEVSTTADIASTGSGLGSSSSVTVGLLHALYTYKGDLPTKARLAQHACLIEIQELKAPIGKQDQYAASYGGLNFIVFQSDGHAEVGPVHAPQETIDTLEQSLLLFYTGIPRKSGQVLLNQKKRIAKNISVLDKLLHIACMMRRLLETGATDGFGKWLNEAWRLKKTMSNSISNPVIDDIYSTAIKAGALGGKLCGAGGGGFMLFYCPVERQVKLREALKNLQELPFRFDRDGSKVIFNIRR